jgi:hypothetical protein
MVIGSTTHLVPRGAEGADFSWRGAAPLLNAIERRKSFRRDAAWKAALRESSDPSSFKLAPIGG